MFFRSERLFLRPGWAEDWNDLFHAISDVEIVRNLATVPWPYAPEDAQGFASMPQDPRFPHFLVTLPVADGARTIGTVGLIDGGAGRTELGYWIARRSWGQGYATEAVRAALTLARTLGHSTVHAAHFHDNPASGRVLRKAGFVPTGVSEARFCLARGEAVAAELHAIALITPNDCDGCDDPLMRAA